MAIPYRPLDPNRQEIRLLRQSPASIMSKSLEYELIHCAFDQKMMYFALSYTWGLQGPQEETTISVDSVRVPVSRNLQAALRSFCMPPGAAIEEESSSDSWHRSGSEDNFAKILRWKLQGELDLDICIWVDQLCINQSDEQEKSQQIGLMAQIYTNAFFVLMWLGEEEENTGLAFDLIREAPVGYPAQLVGMGKEKPKHWEALGSLFARPYWTRVWILQEVLLSRCSAIMCCGPFRMTWIRAALVFEKLTSALLPISTGVPRHILLTTAKMPVSLANRHLDHERGKKFSFLDYLVLSQSRNSFDARDKVFGILGVCEKESIEADYSKKVRDVFKETARYLIEKDQNLDVLSARKRFNCSEFVAYQIQKGFEWLKDGSVLGQHQFDQVNAFLSRNADEVLAMKQQKIRHGYIPSWAPDWSELACENNHLLLRCRDKCHFQASGDTKVMLYNTDDEDCLTLGGFRVGRIETIHNWVKGPPDKFWAQDQFWIQFWPVWIREAGHSNPYGDEEAQKMAYKVTLMSGRGPLGDKDDITPSRPSVDAMLGFGEAKIVDLAKAGPRGLDGVVQFEQACVDNFLGSLCFITEDKHMGRGPLEIEKGDQICILLGGKVPYVLRQFHRKWILIGECYVHGMMEGEALKKCADGCKELKLEQFCLC